MYNNDADVFLFMRLCSRTLQRMAKLIGVTQIAQMLPVLGE